jgi:hypothetical protein
MKIKVSVLVIGLLQIPYHLQSQSSIEGIVIDAKTKEPLPGATKKELKKNHFSIWDSHSAEANEEILFKNNGDSDILYKGELSLVFNPESFYDSRKRGQESTLNFIGRKITIYDNGFYESYQDIQDILLLG